MIKTARILLAINALLYLAIGLLVLIDPASMREPGVVFDTATGATTVRTWGALYVGAAGAALTMASKPDWLLPGVLLVLSIGSLLVAARIIGLEFDGVEPRQWVELRREGTGFLLGLAALIITLIGKRRSGPGL